MTEVRSATAMVEASPQGPVPAIRVEGLTKVYPPNIKAVDSVSFTVEEGEVFGLLGPNGAGKTTIIKSIMTLATPTAGRIFIRGIDARSKQAAARQIMGYVPQEVSVDGDLSAYENLLIFAKFYSVDGSVRKSRIDDALQYMGLEDRANDLVKTFSGGMMRRLEIAQALVNRPKVLFLDEPSIGLDPSARLEVWKHVKALNSELQTTMFLTTHDMLEADKLCSRIAVMDSGKIVVSGTPDELKAMVGGELVIVKTAPGEGRRGAPQPEIPAGVAVSVMRSSVGQGGGQGGETTIVVRGNAEGAIPAILRAYESAGEEVTSISVSRPTLDDVFLQFTKSRIVEAESGRQARSTRRSFRKHAR